MSKDEILNSADRTVLPLYTVADDAYICVDMEDQQIHYFSIEILEIKLFSNFNDQQSTRIRDNLISCSYHAGLSKYLSIPSGNDAALTIVNYKDTYHDMILGRKWAKMACVLPHIQGSELSSPRVLLENGFCKDEQNILSRLKRGQWEFINFTPKSGFSSTTTPAEATLVAESKIPRIFFKCGERLYGLRQCMYNDVIHFWDEIKDIKNVIFISNSKVYINDDSAESGSPIPAGDGKFWKVTHVEDQNGSLKLNYSQADPEFEVTVFFRYKMKDDIEYSWYAKTDTELYCFYFDSIERIWQATLVINHWGIYENDNGKLELMILIFH